MTTNLPGRNFYLAPLNPLHPQDGFGFYEYGSGCCRYYSDGKSNWFFDMDGGKAAFYVSGGCLYARDGKPAGLGIDLSPLSEVKIEENTGPNYLLAKLIMMGRK
jgi:hypothetical protein